jgi:small-conductance mechanosensitive channel
MEQDAFGIVQVTFQDLWLQVISFLPELFGAIVVFIVGLVIAWALRVVVEKVVKALHVDELMEKLKVTDLFKKAGLKLHVGSLLGWIVKWFMIIVFLIAAADILGWSQITSFLNDVVAYIPNAIVAVVILLVGIVLGSFVYEIVEKAVQAAKLGGEKLLAGIAKWSIFLFAFIAALQQLGIASQLLQTITTGLVAMLAIGGGLAFGLGGQDHAKKFLGKLKSDISHN